MDKLKLKTQLYIGISEKGLPMWIFENPSKKDKWHYIPIGDLSSPISNQDIAGSIWELVQHFKDANDKVKAFKRYVQN